MGPPQQRLDAHRNHFELQELSCCQIVYQRQVRLEKIKVRKVGRFRPLNVPEDAVLEFSAIFPDYEEAQLNHGAVRICMLDARNLVSDRGQDAEFFFEFAPQGVAWLLSFLNFSAGKFPFQRHGLVSRSLAHKQLPVLQNEACHYALHDWDLPASFAFMRKLFPASSPRAWRSVVQEPDVQR